MSRTLSTYSPNGQGDFGFVNGGLWKILELNMVVVWRESALKRLGVGLFKSIFRMEGLLRFPPYYTTFSTRINFHVFFGI